MNRRKFINLTATGSAGLLLLPHFLWAQQFDQQEISDNENVLIFIQLNGGNDGLNSFIPFQDPLYYTHRPTIGIPKSQVLNAAQGMGFHPALKSFAQILQEGNLSVIQNVGYPNPNRSHFRSQEIWQTASGSQQYLDQGWLGRFLDIQCNDDSLAAVNFDAIDNLALKSKQSNVLTIKDLDKVKGYHTSNTAFKLSENPQLDFVRKLQYASLEGMADINAALQRTKNHHSSYAANPLAKNLEWISKLIKGNLNSSVYYTSLNGFDTHNNQLGVQQRLLTQLNDAVFSFYNDLKNNNLLSKVTLVVFSEFGRRVAENGSGTDHGTAAPMFVIGGKNKGTLVGKNPNLERLDKGDLIYDIDFRSVYATLLHEKFNFEASKIQIQQPLLTKLFS